MFCGDVDESAANGVAHRLRTADVDVAARSEQAPDERTLLSDQVLKVFAVVRPLARRRHVNVVKHPFGGGRAGPRIPR